MRGIAQIAGDFGDGDIRLTVWQNLLISGVPEARVAEAEAAIAGLSAIDQSHIDPRQFDRLYR
jgi:ferredoxin-nitrite reductase